MKNSKIKGLLILALGVFVLIWTYQHRPSAALVNELNGLFDDTSYSMSETWYYICLVGGVLISVLGIKNLIK